MTSDFEELGPKGCPYLGLEEDRTVMLLDPSPLHRCFANPGDIQAPTVQHQSGFCLTEKHVGCPLYQRAKPQALSAKAKGDGRGGRPNAENSRSGAYVAAGALGLLLVLGGGWLALQFFGGRNEAPPAPALVLSPQPAATNTESAPGTPVITPEAENVVVTAAPTTATTGTATTAANEPATATPEATAVSLYGFVTPTPIAGAQQTEFRPGTGDVGWWTDGPDGQINLNDSYLYAGALDGQNYLAAARFDLKRIPRGTPILGGELRLTGLRADQFDPNAGGTWLVQLLGQSELSTLGGANFMMIYSAPASVTLLPQLTSAEVSVGGMNRWVFDANTLQWIEQQRLNGADTIVARIVGATNPGGQSLFGWDSGIGPTSAGDGPVLALSLGPAPTETPPLPTRDFIVATFTPAPENALTVVAQQATATAGAAIAGTNTPVPYFVTPTPFPQNLATVQAAAAVQQLPAVVVDTPTPASPATATANADYATAVALTTGTFTPVPTGYVTPVRILPSPPPENMLTAVARNEEATAVAASGGPTATPLPYNAVIALYVEATLTPQNLATAAVLAREATAQAALQGTATPTPWEWYVITPTPVPQATATPTLPIFIAEADFTPTPTPLPGSTEVAPAVLPPEFTNKIFFRTNRTGSEEVFVLDPATSSVGKITRDWVYPLATQQLALSPDGTKIVVVKPDNNGILQIYVRSLQYNTDTQLTAFGRDSYDPTWSPTGEWIAFVSTDPGNDEIYRVSVDGKIVQRLTTNSFEWDKHPTWSPDGAQIVFYSNRDTGRRQLWIMDADGGNQRNLTADEFENWEPVWTH